MIRLGRKTQGDTLINIQIKSRETKYSERATPLILILKIEKIHPFHFSYTIIYNSNILSMYRTPYGLLTDERYASL